MRRCVILHETDMHEPRIRPSRRKARGGRAAGVGATVRSGAIEARYHPDVTALIRGGQMVRRGLGRVSLARQRDVGARGLAPTRQPSSGKVRPPRSASRTASRFSGFGSR